MQKNKNIQNLYFILHDGKPINLDDSFFWGKQFEDLPVFEIKGPIKCEIVKEKLYGFKKYVTYVRVFIKKNNFRYYSCLKMGVHAHLSFNDAKKHIQNFVKYRTKALKKEITSLESFKIKRFSKIK